MIIVVRSRLSTLSSIDVELVRPGRPANPDNTKLVESIIKEKDWDYLFPQRHKSYTYTNFLKAVSKFPGVCHPDSPDRCRQVLATMFAHFTQETGGHNPSGGVEEWRQGLHYVEELGCDARDCGYSKNCAGGEWTAKAWPCGKTESGAWFTMLWLLLLSLIIIRRLAEISWSRCQAALLQLQLWSVLRGNVLR